MSFVLNRVESVLQSQRILHPIDLILQPGSITTLLGPIRAGKTSLMRLMAGLDKPTAGRIIDNGQDVTSLDVRRRSVSMVYQQFINYPNFTVYENIVSPLVVSRRLDRKERDRRVSEIAERLGLTKLLKRLPAELSGGQQQRCALARAMVKESRLLLLDEPLVNLDYKLREDLRAEMKSLFRGSDRIVVYATTEPQEAMMLGGQTCVMREGHKLQDGAALDVYRQPADLQTAALISDPAMNFLPGSIAPATGGRGISLDGGGVLPLPADLEGLPDGRYTFGLHAAHLRLGRNDDATALPVVIELAEINGSATLLHGRHHDRPLLMQMTGIYEAAIGASAVLAFDPINLYAFDARGSLARAPRFTTMLPSQVPVGEVRHGAHSAA
nr:ABC transporter ATP-binding protein [uncultured Lichenicoccus sp.]